MDWRAELPVLTGRMVTLREPVPRDTDALVSLLSSADATRFGLDAFGESAVQKSIESFRFNRAHGLAFTFAITMSDSDVVVGLFQVRQLDPDFSTGEWECTLAPSARGAGLFIEAARLAGSFTFREVGAHRLEARVLLRNGRANGALRKLGAVQEGILRGPRAAGGEFADRVLWSLLRDDWKDRWVSTGPRVH